MYAGGHVGGAWGNSTSANYFDQPPVPSDVRLKRDITLVGRLDDGVGLYRYRYLWSDTVYVGVMAQEVALMHPEAIVRSSLDQYLRVDYGRLGMKLMTLPEWNARSKVYKTLVLLSQPAELSLPDHLNLNGTAIGPTRVEKDRREAVFLFALTALRGRLLFGT